MLLFNNTYTATLGINKKIVVTQEPDIINYILKDNHKNYNKSFLTSDKVGGFFGKGLLFANGNYWLQQRRLIQPSFHKQKIEGLYAIMVQSIESFLASFPTGKSVDVYPQMHQLSFNILIQSLFDIKIPAPIMQELNQLFFDLQNFLLKDINQPYQKLFYPLNGAKKKQLNNAKRFREIFINIIEQRRKSNQIYNDLLDMLLHSKYEDTGLTMTTQQIVDEVVILIFAGHETTANTLSWLLHLLATHNNITHELRAALQSHTTYDSFNNPLLKATLNETMRLYPAAWMTDRVAIEAGTVNGFEFPSKTVFIAFFFGMHRDKKLWDAPNSFIPQRFIDDEKLVKSKNFYPFGAGPRMCIGFHFAMAEMSFFVHLFLQKFEFEATDQVPEMMPLITLRPNKVCLNIKLKKV
jgi:cytochrome P450